MKKKILIIEAFILGLIIIFSFGSGAGGGPSGIIYTEFAGEMGYFDFDTKKFAEKISRMGSASSRYDAFDISWDNKKILLTMDVDGGLNFDERRYLLREIKKGFKDYDKVNSGGNIFDGIIEWESISNLDAYISPDENYIAISSQHFSDLPITIIDTRTGKIVSQWEDEKVNFLEYGKPVWTADNTLYFRIGSYLYKCSPQSGYKTATKILQLKEGASNVSVNPQGTKIVFTVDRHIWMSDIDGNNLKQITTSKTVEGLSSGGEGLPIFSPDGKYIAFSSQGTTGTLLVNEFFDGSFVSAVGGKFGYLTIIPANGKLYDMDKGNSDVMIVKGAKSGNRIPLTTTPVWRNK